MTTNCSERVIPLHIVRRLLTNGRSVSMLAKNVLAILLSVQCIESSARSEETWSREIKLACIVDDAFLMGKIDGEIVYNRVQVEDPKFFISIDFPIGNCEGQDIDSEKLWRRAKIHGAEFITYGWPMCGGMLKGFTNRDVGATLRFEESVTGIGRNESVNFIHNFVEYGKQLTYLGKCSKF